MFLRYGGNMKAVMRAVLMSREFWNRDAYFARYAWPVEFVVRSLKEVGWTGFSVNVNDTLAPLGNMGQNLFEPPGRDRVGRSARAGSRPARCSPA